MSFDHWKIDRMLSKNIEASGLNVFYGEAGREDAPKLVLLHGFPAYRGRAVTHVGIVRSAEALHVFRCRLACCTCGVRARGRADDWHHYRQRAHY